MAAQDWVPYFTIPGSVIAIVTGCFVIWERFFRNEPSAFIVSAPQREHGSRFAHLRIVNRSERPIIVSWSNVEADGVLRVLKEQSIAATLYAAAKPTTSIAVDGNATKDLLLHLPKNWGAMRQAESAEITITWQFVQPHVWKKPRSFVVRIAKREYIILMGEGDRLDEVPE